LRSRCNPVAIELIFSLVPILDPTHLEATLASGALTITLNAQRALCVLSKAGGTALAPSEIMTVVRVGVDRVRDLVKLMEEALEDDRSRRVVEVI
jgi:exosome complex component RRP45